MANREKRSSRITDATAGQETWKSVENLTEHCARESLGRAQHYAPTVQNHGIDLDPQPH